MATQLRRQPKQARSRERIERMLDATERVLVDVGFENATTNQIAAEADTSVGSLYEFFPNKEVLASALADRYLERLGAVFDAWGDDPDATGEQLVSRFVTDLSRFWRRNPGVAPLLRGSFGAPELVDAGEALRVVFVRTVSEVLRARRPDRRPVEVETTAEIAVDMARCLLERAQAQTGVRRKRTLEHLQIALVGYIRASLGEPLGHN